MKVKAKVKAKAKAKAKGLADQAGRALLLSTGDFVVESTLITNAGGEAVFFEGAALPGSLLVHNTITSSGVGVHCAPGAAGVLVAQSIVRGNTVQITGVCDVAESFVEGGQPGFRNVDIDPLFVDAANGDFKLDPASAARDASVLSVQPLDVEGRVRDAFPDIGAFEAVP